MAYKIYVVQNEKPDSLDGLTAVATVGNPPQTISYAWLPDQIYWVGVSAVTTGGSESTTASWFRVYTSSSGYPFKPLAKPYNVRAIPITGGQLTVSFNIRLDGDAQEPYYHLTSVYDNSTKLTSINLGTRVLGQTYYEYTFTPSIPSGVLRVSPLSFQGLSSILFDSISVPFSVDSVAPTNTILAKIG